MITIDSGMLLVVDRPVQTGLVKVRSINNDLLIIIYSEMKVLLYFVFLMMVDTRVVRNRLIDSDRLMKDIGIGLDSIYIHRQRFKEDDLVEMVKDMDNEQADF